MRLCMARRSIWARAKHRVGLERPHFCTRFRAQSESWVAPAQQETSLGARGENLVEAAEEGRNYLLQLRLQHLLQLGDAHKSRENEEMNDTRMRKVTQKKTPDWAGATPLFRLSAAQKVRGVAPARHARSVTVCCPRAQRELLRRTSETIFPLATHGSRLELNRRVVGECLFSRRYKWLITHITS